MVIEGGLPRVLDAQNEYVAHERLLATPERIATIYYARDDASGGPDCGGAEGGLAARFHLIINPDQVDHVETRTVRLDELRMIWRAGLVSLRDTSLPSSIGSDLNRDASCVYWHSQSDGCDSWQNVARVLVVPDREYDYEANFGGIVERLK